MPSTTIRQIEEALTAEAIDWAGLESLLEAEEEEIFAWPFEDDYFLALLDVELDA